MSYICYKQMGGRTGGVDIKKIDWLNVLEGKDKCRLAMTTVEGEAENLFQALGMFIPSPHAGRR